MVNNSDGKITPAQEWNVKAMSEILTFNLGYHLAFIAPVTLHM